VTRNWLAAVSRPSSLGAISACLWLVIWGFALWPFNFRPSNQTTWLRDRNGIHFDRYGQAFSVMSWSPGAAGMDKSFSLEIWLRSWERRYPRASAIFSIDNPGKPSNFAIVQSLSDISIRGQFLTKAEHGSVFQKLWLDDVLHGIPRFITLTSGPEGTALYLEGIFQGSYPLILAVENFNGKLLLGHHPSGPQSWTGDVFGLALYQRQLTGKEVADHYREWQETRTAPLMNVEGIMAFYPFDERTGDVIHNRAGSAPDLVIPKTFEVLHKEVLHRQFDVKNPDWKDIIINILGFAPLGFFVSARLRAASFGKTSAVILATLLGGITSLAIELLQVYLPSRDSSLVDLIDNTLGTILGATLFTWFATTLRRWNLFQS
jgi:VanZ family protein